MTKREKAQLLRAAEDIFYNRSWDSCEAVRDRCGEEIGLSYHYFYADRDFDDNRYSQDLQKLRIMLILFFRETEGEL